MTDLVIERLRIGPFVNDRQGQDVYAMCDEVENLRAVISELIVAAEPFVDGNVVDETTGTIPLMNHLQDALEKAEKLR